MKTIPFHKLYGLDWEAKDLHARYQNTYLDVVVMSNTAGVQSGPLYTGVVYLHQAYIENMANHSRILVYDHENKKKNGAWPDKIVRWDDLFVQEDRPSACISNLKDSALMYSWNPERQWQRGVSAQNGYWRSGPKMQLQNNHGIGFDQAERIYSPQHCKSLAEGLAQFEEAKISARALSNVYWLGRSDNAITLNRRLCFLGSFIGKKFFPNAATNFFREELKMELPTLKGMYA